MEMELANMRVLNEFSSSDRIAVFFDDQRDTIVHHVQRAKDAGLSVIFAKNEIELFEAMSALWNRAVFFVDMHVPKIFNLEAIGYKNIDTLTCSAFATAIFQAFRLKFERALNFPYILSGRGIAEKAYDSISDLEDSDFNVKILEKDETKLADFDAAIQNYQDAMAEMESSIKELSSIQKEKFISIDNIIDEWFGSDIEIKSKIYGFSSISEYTVSVVDKSIFTVDIEDKCDAIYRIKKNLLSIFDDHIEREKRWLSAENPYLDNSSPKEFLVSGHQNKIFRLISILEKV